MSIIDTAIRGGKIGGTVGAVGGGLATVPLLMGVFAAGCFFGGPAVTVSVVATNVGGIPALMGLIGAGTVVGGVSGGALGATAGGVAGGISDISTRIDAYYTALEADMEAEDAGNKLAKGNERLEKSINDFKQTAEDHKETVAQTSGILDSKIERLNEVGKELKETQSVCSENVRSQRQTAEVLNNVVTEFVEMINPALEQTVLEQHQEIATLKKELADCRLLLRDAVVALDQYQSKAILDDEENLRLKNELAFSKAREAELMRLLVSNGVRI